MGVLFEVQGENKMGGTVDAFYSVYLEDSGSHKKGDWEEQKNIVQISDPNESIDVGGINKAITEYFDEKGLL